ncbi:MAG: hypothetical protein AAB821_00910, partial [Patescibacteria group bacterium]
NIYQVTYDASKTSRTIKVKFKLACLTAKPEDTIKALRAGQPAQINTKTFREWVGQTGNYSLDGKSYTSVEEMVKAEMERGQCEYVEDLYSWYDNYTKIRNSFIQTLKSIKPVIEMKRPALFGVLIFETGAHSVVALDVKELPSPLPGWFGAKKYKITYIDSNGWLGGSLAIVEVECREKLIDPQPPFFNHRIRGLECPITTYGKAFLVKLDKPSTTFNSWIRQMNSVRIDAIEWIKNNHTTIYNGPVSSSPGGFCHGWSEFNIKASLLIKECPWKGGANGGGIGISAVNKKWQMASLWQSVDQVFDFTRELFRNFIID